MWYDIGKLMGKFSTKLSGVKKIVNMEMESGKPVKGGKVSSGAASMRSKTVRMKQVRGVKAVNAGVGVASVEVLGSIGRGARAKVMSVLSETDHTRSRALVPLGIEKEAICDYAAGASIGEIENKYAISRGYVDYALRRRFGSLEAGKKALMGMIMENALACNVHASAHIEELSAPQAIMSGAILVDKVIALERSIVEAPRTIDFGQLAEMDRTLRVLREIKVSREKQAQAVTAT
jgi:hypothetical protein